MTDSLNYLLQRIEYNYLCNNRIALMSKDIICLQDEDLPCNCVTGIVVNYSAFLTRICMRETTCEATMEMLDKGHYYVQCREGAAIVCPVLKPNDKNTDYSVGKRLCNKTKGMEAYIPFPSYSELKHIENELKEYVGQHMVDPDNMLYLEFWIRFLGAMRVQPLSITSRAFLFMAIYLFPSRTLKLMWDSKGEFDFESLEAFMKDYLLFLTRIGGCKKLGFQQRFVHAFKDSTNIDISAFIEKLSPRNYSEKDVFLETLIAGYNRNMSEVSRERGSIKKFCETYLNSEGVKTAYYNILAELQQSTSDNDV